MFPRLVRLFPNLKSKWVFKLKNVQFSVDKSSTMYRVLLVPELDHKQKCLFQGF